MAVILLLGVTAIIICGCRGQRYLVLEDGDTGTVYGEYKVKDGDQFSVTFVHSVNKSPLTDVYEVRDNDIYVVQTIYYGFGAGVQTEIEPGQKLSYGEDGSMIVSGFNQKLDPLSYIVGTVSDHTLKIGEREISLRDLCGRNSTVKFSIKKRRF